LAVGGCTTTVEEMSYTQLQEYATGMAEKCRKMGVPDEQLEACAVQEISADQARRRKQRQLGAAIAGASQAYGNALQQSAYSNRMVTCTSTPSGSWVGGPVSQVRTTCY